MGTWDLAVEELSKKTGMTEESEESEESRKSPKIITLSRYYLMSGCEFFNDTFSIPNENLTEGTSDEEPVVLPIESAEFNVYLFFDQM